jgi:hypothetical protein
VKDKTFCKFGTACFTCGREDRKDELHYSTEAVDALLDEIAAGLLAGDHWHDLELAAEALRASKV